MTDDRAREDEFAWHEANGPVIDDERYMPVTIARQAAQPVAVSAEQVERAWHEAEHLEVDDPNGAEFGTVLLPFNAHDRMLLTFAALGITVEPTP